MDRRGRARQAARPTLKGWESMGRQAQPAARHTALITGASGGIGCELASLFARDGYDLVLVSRSTERLSSLAARFGRAHGISVTVITQDLAGPAAAEEIVTQMERAGIRVDALVNNAGFGVYGRFVETDWVAERESLHVNMMALTGLTKLLLPGMIQRGRGRILNVASTAAFQPGPLMAVYYASKAYVLSFSEALANELHGCGVSVTALCPGPTASGFQRRARIERSRLARGPVMDAATVARIGYEGMMRGRRVVIPGWRNRLLARLVRVVPRRVVTRAVRMAQESA